MKKQLTMLVAVGMLVALAGTANAGIITPTDATSTSTIGGHRTIDTTIDSSGLSSGGLSGDILAETHTRANPTDDPETDNYWLSAKNATSLELIFTIPLSDIDSIHQWMYDNDNLVTNRRGLKTFDISFSRNGGTSYFSSIAAATLGDFSKAITLGQEAAQTKTFAEQTGVDTIKLSNITNFGEPYFGLSEIRFGGTAVPERGVEARPQK